MVLILLFFVLIFFSYREIFFEKNNLLFFYLLAFIVAIIDGLRWNSGVDFQMYHNSYTKLFNSVDLHNGRYDFLYLLLTKLFKILNLHYTFFLLGISLFTTFLYVFTIKKFTQYPIFALLCFFVNIIGFWGNNRQLIALGIVFFSIQFLIKRKYLLFVTCVLIASGFHFTAIMMLFLPICNMEFKRHDLLALVVFGLLSFSILSEKNLLWFFEINKDYFPHFHERFNSYKKINHIQIDPVFLILGIARKLLPVCFLFYFRKSFSKLDGYHFFLNISILSLVVYLWVKFNFVYLAGRFTIYFSIYECIIYSWFGYIVLKSNSKRILFLFFVIFFGFVFWKSISLYPHLFVPYNTIFFSF
ncbi:EpsG family protein [Flavobacterium terrae]|uniref:EpsG family protein n=1 Tax=Flavobacterium terrae TaxID=415425 RepID=A0A1M6FT87_9FLAO|nr:EpsG family protein [Flavobacterium terrae]